MRCINRLKKLEDEDFDKIILDIKLGRVKAGRYSTLVTVDGNKKFKGGDLFGTDSDE